MTAGHIAFWELLPTIDHIRPVARGGEDIEENYVTCSMISNSIKSNWTLEQIGWELLPPGDVSIWDGLLSLFIEQIENDRSLLVNPYFKRWHGAALEHRE